MKCHHCSHIVKIWQTFCPSCGIRLQSKSFSTINEAAIPVEPSRRRRTLRKALQFALLALAVIILASAVRLGPPRANSLTKEAVKSVVVVTPTPTPEPALSPVPTPPPTVAETRLAPINLLTDVFELDNAARSATPKVAQTTTTRRTETPISLVGDEAPAKKLGKPAMLPPPPPISPDTPPPPPVRVVEPDANLEVEAPQTFLQANVGLVSIKSYVPARIYIDGVYSGVTPRSVKLLAGEHSISLMAGGYQEYTRRVKVGGQQQIGILASLSKKP